MKSENSILCAQKESAIKKFLVFVDPTDRIFYLLYLDFFSLVQFCCWWFFSFEQHIWTKKKKMLEKSFVDLLTLIFLGDVCRNQVIFGLVSFTNCSLCKISKCALCYKYKKVFLEGLRVILKSYLLTTSMENLHSTLNNILSFWHRIMA